MRLATLIISLVLVLVAGIQSCAVAVGGSIAKDLSAAASDKQKGEDLAGAGGLGIFAAIIWVVGAGFVLNKPNVSMWVFGIASVLWLGAAAAGFSDAYIWMVASILFALMSWRGIKEKRDKDWKGQARFPGNHSIAQAGFSAARAADRAGVEKKCPDCAEAVLADARRCKHCGYLFGAEEA